MSYCRIYIHDDRNIDDIQKIVDKYISLFFFMSNIEAIVYRNKNFHTFNKYNINHLSTDTRYSVEVGDDNYDDNFDTDEFKKGVAYVVIELCKIFNYVSVSCKFEDYIFEKTGWNRTPEKPIPLN